MEEKKARELVRRTFKNIFDLDGFKIFISNLFNNFEIKSYTYDEYNLPKRFQDYVKNYLFLGRYTDPEKYELDVLIVNLKKSTSRDRARTMQRNFVAEYLKKNGINFALVAFYGEDIEDWRLSFVKLEHSISKRGDIEEEVTPARRYSFLVGKNEFNHTAQSRLVSIVQDESDIFISRIEDAFSVEKVTQEFFEKYRELFIKLQEATEKILRKDKNVYEEFKSKGIESSDFAKKVLGQIVFLYFLQKKGWLGIQRDLQTRRFKRWGDGDKNFLQNLFYRAKEEQKNFFNDYLEPLFYQALAKDRSEDDHYYDKLDCRIPFLNGGLFEPIGNYSWTSIDILFDNDLFDEIFTEFNTYNFTVKEDEPLEKEVAIDPEMLGKVFENLLEVKDRKSKGSYYTPREIVHYMCQESLINYLETGTGIKSDIIKKFIGQEFSFTLPKQIEENKEKIDKLLAEIKLVDPASGSGAFIVGMMGIIVRVRSALNSNYKNYELKRECIENSLYGVDIDPSAIDICQLRLWLSLIVDEEAIEDVKPLPNLDYKIMCGNSLLEEFEGVKLFDEKLLGEFQRDHSFEIKQIDEKIDELYREKGDVARGKKDGKKIKDIEREIKKLERKKSDIKSKPRDDLRNSTFDEIFNRKIKESQKKLTELKKLQKEYVNQQNRTIKKHLREDIDRIEWEFIEEALKEHGNVDALKGLKQYRKLRSKPFFLWKLHFSEIFQHKNPGFDVVIGNPPYIDYRKIDNTTKQGLKDYETYKTTKTGSIYVYFIERGLTLTRKNGTLVYINPYQYLIADSGEGIRKVLVDKFVIQRIVDISHIRVFQEAATYTCINIFRNTQNLNNKIEIVRCKNLTDLTKAGFNISQNEVKTHNNYAIYITENLELLSKIEDGSETLSDVCSDVFCGTSAGGFGKKIINKNQYAELNETKKKKYRPVIQSSEIKKYHLDVKNNYIERNIYPIHVQKKFEEEKIFFARMTKSTRCAYSKEFLFAGKVNVLTKFEIDPKYLMAILNSRLIDFWYNTKFESKHLSGGYLGFDIPSIKTIPVRRTSNDKQKRMIELVDQILSMVKDKDYTQNLEKQIKVMELEKEIDQFVYQVYGLTKEEQHVIENSIK